MSTSLFDAVGLILILTTIFCSLFLFYSSASGTRGKLYAESTSDLTGINFVSIKKVKQIVTNHILTSGYKRDFITKAGNEYLKAATWGTIVLVKIETKAKRFIHVDYYYMVHGILSDQGIVATSSINALTGKMLMNAYFYRQYGNRYLITGEKAAKYALNRLNLSSQINYTISTVMNYSYPHSFDYLDWMYKIVFDQYVATREGMVNTVYVIPYILAAKKEPPTPLNAPHSDIYPNRLFILVQSVKNPDMKEYIGID